MTLQQRTPHQMMAAAAAGGPHQVNPDGFRRKRRKREHTFSLINGPYVHQVPARYVPCFTHILIPIPLVFPSASDYTKPQRKPTVLSMSYHPSGPTVDTHPTKLEKNSNHVDFALNLFEA